MKSFSDVVKTGMHTAQILTIIAFFVLTATSSVMAQSWPPRGDVKLGSLAATPLGLPSNYNNINTIVPFLKSKGLKVSKIDKNTWRVYGTNFPFTVSGLKIDWANLDLYDNGSVSSVMYVVNTTNPKIDVFTAYEKGMKVINETKCPDEEVEDWIADPMMLYIIPMGMGTITLKRDSGDIDCFIRVQDSDGSDMAFTVNHPRVEATRGGRSSGGKRTTSKPQGTDELNRLIEQPMGNIVHNPATVDYRGFREAVESKYPAAKFHGNFQPGYNLNNPGSTLLGKPIDEFYIDLNNYEIYWSYYFYFDSKTEADSFFGKLKQAIPGVRKFENFWEISNKNGKAGVSIDNDFDKIIQHKQRVIIRAKYERPGYTPPRYEIPLSELTENILTVDGATVSSPAPEIVETLMKRLYECSLTVSDNYTSVVLSPKEGDHVNMELFIPAPGGVDAAGFVPVYMDYRNRGEDVSYEISLDPVTASGESILRVSNENEKIYKRFISDYSKKEPRLKKGGKKDLEKRKIYGIKECRYVNQGDRTDYYVLKGSGEFLIFSIAGPEKTK